MLCYWQDEMTCHLYPILCTWDAVTTCTPVTVFFPLGVQLSSKINKQTNKQQTNNKQTTNKQTTKKAKTNVRDEALPTFLSVDRHGQAGCPQTIGELSYPGLFRLLHQGQHSDTEQRLVSEEVEVLFGRQTQGALGAVPWRWRDGGCVKGRRGVQGK